MGRTLKELGININFSLVLDTNRNPSYPALGRKERCFSDEPEIVKRPA
jgi:beta-N-acetylhexosaminidase